MALIGLPKFCSLPAPRMGKPGPHLTLRYVLGDEKGTYSLGKDKRGDVAWIWEVRVGRLELEHFKLSNTPGDSGKTAVISAAGLAQLPLVYLDLDRCPCSPRGKMYKLLVAQSPLRPQEPFQ